MFSKRHMVRIICIACFAVLMAALAPAVSQMLAARDAHAATSSADCHTKAAHALSNHCGYCVMQADLPFLPALTVAPLPPERPASMAPPLFHLAPSPLFIWLAAQPRAPPAA
jgi:hypothetical protein